MDSSNKMIEYKISIIIPIYNIEKYLEQTLDSLIMQTIGFENIEVIMVNDCSTDSSGEIIDNYAVKYENFIAVHLTENCGLPGKPRNIGLERATGEYVMFMDHDDYYSDDACEVFYNEITTENADVIFSRYNYVFERGIKPNFNRFGNMDEIKLNTIDEDKRILKIAPSIWTKMFKRKFLIENNIQFPEGMLAEDLSFVVHSFLKANKIIYLNNYFSYNYRIRDSGEEKSTIHIRNKKYLMSMIKGYYNVYNVLNDQKKEEYFSIIFEGNLQYWMSCFILSDTSQSEKKELLENVVFLFKKLNEYNFEIDQEYLLLFKDIANEEFDNAILLSEMMVNFKKREINLNENYQKLRENYKKLDKKYKKSRTNYQKLQKQMENKKKQVAELQTAAGWFDYKTKNVFDRFKRKIKSNP
jgi:poly(ribitol-phosphate) beta-N-acetylglucosaminyltransferase